MKPKTVIRKEKSAYRENVAGSYTNRNMKKSWDGIRFMSGHTKKPDCRHFPATNMANNIANDIDKIYNHFDEHDFSAEQHKLQTSLSTPGSKIAVSEREDREHFEKLCLSNGAGPDNLASKTLKYSATKLSLIFPYIINLSIKIGQVVQL